MTEKDKGITVKKEEDMPEWYEQVCLKAELAEFSTVKGCMIIRPNGYSIWQAIQDYFNENIIKKTNVRNAYLDRKSTRLNSSHIPLSRMPSSA